MPPSAAHRHPTVLSLLAHVSLLITDTLIYARLQHTHVRLPVSCLYPLTCRSDADATRKSSSAPCSESRLDLTTTVSILARTATPSALRWADLMSRTAARCVPSTCAPVYTINLHRVTPASSRTGQCNEIQSAHNPCSRDGEYADETGRDIQSTPGTIGGP
ncbi:hypothetical protein CALVIDRAFT_407254 [Calocera viscosa TUFC12733]|uniref:Secreted protein n=1 Tax=Calocera viscosa (strain TUFC12733) TaxID=1330018 RepID=A0A167PZ37_CALVF|nr:hypothetical protein CALVIDRAFT_407254 [Calocera viscosa TUFC12733]